MLPHQTIKYYIFRLVNLCFKSSCKRYIAVGYKIFYTDEIKSPHFKYYDERQAKLMIENIIDLWQKPRKRAGHWSEKSRKWEICPLHSNHSCRNGFCRRRKISKKRKQTKRRTGPFGPGGGQGPPEAEEWAETGNSALLLKWALSKPTHSSSSFSPSSAVHPKCQACPCRPVNCPSSSHS